MFLWLDILIKGGNEDDSDLYWDSWDSYHLRKEMCPKPILSRARSSVPSESCIPYHNNNNDIPTASVSLTLSSPPCISSLKQECGKCKEKLFNYFMFCYISTITRIDF